MTAEVLARDFGISVRTVYRDIATLVGQGVAIEGAPGLGYLLRPGFFLPPMMLGEDEADAVILGLRMVERRGDASLAAAARNAAAKIVAVLPPALEGVVEAESLLAGPAGPGSARHLAGVREAMRAEHKLRLRYADAKGQETDRTVWPITVGFFEAAEVLAAWCEARDGFRHFRLDRILDAASTGERLPRRRRVLLAQWRREQGLDRQG